MSRFDDELIDPYNDFDHAASQRHEVQKKSDAPSGWGALIAGRTLGKVANIQFLNNVSETTPVDLLEVKGDDKDAIQLSIIFGPIGYNASTTGIALKTPQLVNSFQDTLQIFKGYFADPPAAVNFSTYGNFTAIIEWGLGASHNIVEVDILNGTGINLSAASWVRVRCKLETVDISLSSGIYQVLGYVGPGLVKSIGAQKSVSWGDQDLNTESNLMVVPRFARMVHLVGMDKSGVIPGVVMSGAIRFWRGQLATAPNGALAEYRFTGLVGNLVPVPIPAGAAFFTIVSYIPSPNTFEAVFQLAV